MTWRSRCVSVGVLTAVLVFYLLLLRYLLLPLTDNVIFVQLCLNLWAE